jgi:glycine cleavage system regulatory protein
LHHLSGFFAGVIEVAVASEKSESLISELKAISGLSCQIEMAKPNLPDVVSNLVLEITANDRAGIVQEVSSVIHHQSGNLIKLVSSKNSAAHTGQDIFKAKVQIDIDNKLVDDLINALEKIADDLMVDISR